MDLLAELRAETGPNTHIADLCQRAINEIERLHAITDHPENDDFIRGLSIEAEHQARRWGHDHDAGKNGWDWFWTIGFLSQKAAAALQAGDFGKAKHHCISTAALMKNMHRHVAEKEEYPQPAGFGRDQVGD